jgi:hypothetical protein
MARPPGLDGPAITDTRGLWIFVGPSTENEVVDFDAATAGREYVPVHIEVTRVNNRAVADMVRLLVNDVAVISLVVRCLAVRAEDVGRLLAALAENHTVMSLSFVDFDFAQCGRALRDFAKRNRSVRQLRFETDAHAGDAAYLRRMRAETKHIFNVMGLPPL